MTTIWGIHNDHPDLDQIGNEFVAVGWDEVGDVKAIGPNKKR